MIARFISCLLLFAGVLNAAAVPKCHMETLEACGEPLKEFRDETGEKFPTNEEQVTKLCTKLDEASSCLDKFKQQCMTPLQLQIMSFLSDGAYAVYDEFCTSGSNVRNDYLKHAECLNSAYDSDEYKDLASYVEAGLEDLHEKPNSKKLSTACCGYQWMDKNMKKLGEDKCGAEAVNSFEKVTRMAVSTLPDAFCQGFDPEDDQCKGVLPPPGTKPTGNIRNSHIAKTFSSVYLGN